MLSTKKTTTAVLEEFVGHSNFSSLSHERHADRARLAEEVLKAMEAQGIDPVIWLDEAWVKEFMGSPKDWCGVCGS